MRGGLKGGRGQWGAGEASRRAAGRREPLTCAAEEAELQQPMAGPKEPGGGAGRAATPRSPSACEPAGARGGRGLAPHGSAVTAAARTAAGTQEAARLGAVFGHIPRRRRLRDSCSAPAAAAAPQRKGAGGGGASPCLPPPASRAQSLSRSLSRAAASSAPRASPIRLPAPSAAPRGRPGGGGQNEAGPFGARRSLRSTSPFSCGTVAERCLRAKGRSGLRSLRSGQARSRKGTGLLPDPGDTGGERGVASCPRWERNPKILMASSVPTAAFYP